MSYPVNLPKRILVVDDEPFICEAVRMMLEFDGHQIETVSSGPEALLMLEKGGFDLVITDFSMPGMEGNELAVKIRARDPKLPIMMITDYAEMLFASKTPLDAVDCVISKPFLLEDLRAAITEVTAPK